MVLAAERRAEQDTERIEMLAKLLLILMILVIIRNVIRGYQLIILATSNSRLSKKADIDQAPGLYNKGKCEERLANPFIIGNNVLIACCMFDLNNLKQINDHYGHKAGDELIKTFVKILSDCALAHMFIGRFGGDEFIAVSAQLSHDEVNGFIKQLTDTCNGTKIVDGSIDIDFAYGCAFSDEFSAITVAKLMEEADKRMYVDKQFKKQLIKKTKK